jgi:hypothetical protein
MKATSLGLLSILLVVFPGQSQEWEWVNSAHGLSHDYARDMVTNSNGEIIVVGSFNSSFITFDSITLQNYSLNGDGYIVKYDMSGEIIWLTKIGGNGNDEIYQVALDSQDNIYCMGIFSDSLTVDSQTIYGDSESNVFFSKFDTNANMIWLKAFAGVSNFWSGYDIDCDNFDNLYFSGSFDADSVFFQGDTLINHGGIDIFIVKLNTAGNLLWSRNFGGKENDCCHSQQCDNSGNLFFSGWLNSDSVVFDTVVLSSNYSDIGMGFIAKYSHDGEFIQINSSQQFYWNNIAFDSDNNFYLSSYDMDWWVSEKIIISKFDNDCELIWEKQFSGFGFDFCNSIFVKNNSIYFTGMFSSDSIRFGDYLLFNDDLYHYDGYISRMSNNGEVYWAKHIGGEHIEYPYSIVVDNSNDVLVSGFFWNDIHFDDTSLVSEGQCDIFVVKLGNDHNGIVSNNYSSCNELIIYPNPNQGSFKVKIKNDLSSLTNLKVFNANGYIVYSKTLNLTNEQKEYSIQLPPSLKGVYFLEAINEEKAVYKKVIIK